MNNPLWRVFSGTVRGINQAMAYLSALLILVCSLVLVYEVITRYVIQVSNDWVIELSIFMLIAATFLAAAHTQRERGHVGIEILDEVMSKQASRIRIHDRRYFVDAVLYSPTAHREAETAKAHRG